MQRIVLRNNNDRGRRGLDFISNILWTPSRRPNMRIKHETRPSDIVDLSVLMPEGYLLH